MELKKLAEALKTLGDPTRLKIITLLRTRDCCVCELVPIFGLSQPAISQHLSKLKGAEFVTETRRGQWVFYSLNQEKLKEIGIALENLPDLSNEFELLKEKGLLVVCD